MNTKQELEIRKQLDYISLYMHRMEFFTRSLQKTREMTDDCYQKILDILNGEEVSSNEMP